MKLGRLYFLFAMFAMTVLPSAQAGNGLTLFPRMFEAGACRESTWRGHSRSRGFWTTRRGRGENSFSREQEDGWRWGPSWIAGDNALPTLGPNCAWTLFLGDARTRSHRNHHSADFVEKWLERIPESDTGADSGLSRSPLLSEGMGAEGVLRLLGSPIRRDRRGQTEVWRYSSYSLTFEGERLVKVR